MRHLIVGVDGRLGGPSSSPLVIVSRRESVPYYLSPLPESWETFLPCSLMSAAINPVGHARWHLCDSWHFLSFTKAPHFCFFPKNHFLPL